MTFILSSAFEKDTLLIGDLPLCRALLMNHADYPWVILVPRRADMVEWTDLPAQDQPVLWQEVARTMEVLKMLFSPYKLNVAALGNITRQLHVHVIARQSNDPAWPHPVWGMAGNPYPSVLAQERVMQIQQRLL